MFHRLDAMTARVQLLSTEDTATGVQLLIGQHAMPEYRKIVAFLAALLLNQAGIAQAASPTDHTARRDAQLLETEAQLVERMDRLCMVPALKHRPLVDLIRRAAADPEVYWELMDLPADSETLRCLAAVMHSASYRWFRWHSLHLAEDVCYLMDTQSALLRGLQTYFRAAAGRGDAYETTPAMQSTAAKKVLGWLKKSPAAKRYAEAQVLARWLEPLKEKALDNVVRAEAVYI